MLVLVVFLFLPSLVFSQAIISCKAAPIYDTNSRIYGVLEPGTPQRCYRFVFPTRRDISAIIEPCTGPMPIVLTDTKIGSGLSRTNFSVSAETFDLAQNGIVVEATQFSGNWYLLVTHNDDLYNKTTSSFMIRVVDAQSVPLPTLGSSVLKATKQTDTTLRLVWEAAQDSAGITSLSYAIYGFEEKPAYLANAYSARRSEDDDEPYFLHTLCSAEANSVLLRAFSPLTLTLRGEQFLLSPDNLTLHWDLEGLKNGFYYKFNVYAKNVFGQIVPYDSLRTKTWQIGPLGTGVLIVIFLIYVFVLVSYFLLKFAARKRRREMFVSAQNLPKKSRYFTVSDIEGYFYVLPKKLLKSLDPDEELVWAGRPEYSLYTDYWLKAYAVLGGALILILFVIGWFFVDIWIEAILWPYLLVFGIASLLFFLTMSFPGHTAYALTTKRAIIYTRYMWFWRVVDSYPYETMYAGFIRSELTSDGSGSIFFDLQQSYLFCRKKPIGFWNVLNAHRAVLHINHFREEFYKKYFLHDEPFSMRGNVEEEPDRAEFDYLYS